MQRSFLRNVFCGLCLSLVFAAGASAQDAGQVKVSVGSVSIERAGQRLPAPVGTAVRAEDTVITGAGGSVGLTFSDNSRLSAGPNSTLAINRYAFNPATHDGAFDATLKRGTLFAVSGKIAKQSPDAMTVSTPWTTLGVRGTEFVVRVSE